MAAETGGQLYESKVIAQLFGVSVRRIQQLIPGLKGTDLDRQLRMLGEILLQQGGRQLPLIRLIIRERNTDHAPTPLERQGFTITL